MKKLRTLLAVLLSFSLCVSLLVPAMATDGDTQDAPPAANEITETAEKHDDNIPHNSQVKDGEGNVIGTWVCTVEYVNDGDCTLKEHTHGKDACTAEGTAVIKCGLRLHEHTDACYAEKEVEVEVPVLDAEGNPVLDAEGNPTTTTETQTKRELTCPLTEHKEHVDSCYTCDTPEHSHKGGASCQFEQKAVWTCHYEPKGEDKVTEDGKLPEKNPGNVSDKNNIYVYIEPDSIANYDPNGTANGHSYMTLAKIEITAELLEKYNNGKETDNSLYIPSGTKSDGLSAEQFNALVNFALKNAGAKDKDGNIVSVDGKNVDNINWVYVKGSDGATDFVDCGSGTVHADGHAHKLEVVSNAEGDKSPTCTEGGYITYKCQKRIGTTYQLDDNQQPVRDKNGNLVVATLGEVCGYTMKVYSAPLGHDFSGSWKDAGDGTHSIKCSRCKEVMSQSHNWVVKTDWSEWKQAANYATSHEWERTRVLECNDHCGVDDRTERQTKLDGQYILTYVCKAGDEEIGSGTVGAFYPGGDYEYGPPAITGYTATTGTQTGKMPNGDHVLVFEYTVNEYPLIINYLYAGTNAVAAEKYEGRVAYKADYSVASPTVTGYTTTTRTVEGTMPAEKVEVTVYYSAIPDDPTPTTPIEEEVDEPEVPLVEEPPVEDIEEPEVPREEEPEIEIEEPDVPLAEVPETGDGSGLWFVSAVLSAMGLVLLFFTRKREGQEG